MTNNFSEPSDSGHAYSLSLEISMTQLGINILVLKELGVINAEDLISMMRMMRSPDLENYTIVKSIVDNLLKKVNDEYARKT